MTPDDGDIRRRNICRETLVDDDDDDDDDNNNNNNNNTECISWYFYVNMIAVQLPNFKNSKQKLDT
jgi:hypothetical protein